MAADPAVSPNPGTPPSPPAGRRVPVFRWKAVVPLGVFVGLLVAFWLLFANTLVRRGIEAAGTALLGAKVEIASARISLGEGRLTLRGVTAASPSEALKNLFQADELDADFELLPLLEKKVIIDRLAATGLRFGTPRATDGRVKSSGPSLPAQVAGNVSAWARAVNVPVIQLATGTFDVGTLDPTKLRAVAAARALGARADSVSAAWTAAAKDLHPDAVADSATAVANRLQAMTTPDLRVIADARRMLDLVTRTRDQVAALERSVTSGADSLRAGVAGLDAARRADYDFAKSLVRLPALEAGDVGAALFGGAAVARVQRGLQLLSLARAYMPPGLQPHTEPGPRRVRRAGLTVRFPRARALPGFLLREGAVSFTLGQGAAAKQYAGTLRGLTSAPALYGKPTTFDASAPALAVGGLLDHVRATARDTVGAVLGGVALPALAVGGLPVRLEPGTGTMTARLALVGDSLRATWGVHTTVAQWARDASFTGGAAGLVWDVVSGIHTVDFTAEIVGPLAAPALHVRSNLDQAIATRLRAALGAKVADAETALRRQVDAAVDSAVAPVKARVAQATAQASSQLDAARGRLGAAQNELQSRLRALTGGILH